MKRPLLLLLILICSLHSFSLPGKKYISLEKQNIPLKNFGFRLERVINATNKTRLIGWVEKKSTYTRIPALFVEDIDLEMSSFIKRNLMPSSMEFNLIVRINDLTVYETHRDFSEKTVANVSLTFIFRKDNRYFEKFTVSRHESKIVSTDATKWLPEVIAKTIAQCFDAFYEQHLNKKLENIEIAENELVKKPLGYHELQKKYLNIDRSEKGIYKTFFDFQQGTPDTLTDFDIEYRTKSTRDGKVFLRYTLIKNAKTGDPINDVWGFTDGKQVFTLVGKSYLPFYKDDKGYYLRINSGTEEAKKKLKSLMTAQGYLGGVLNAAIIASSSPYQLMRLDIVSGKVVFLSDPFNTEIIKEDENTIRFFSSSYNSKHTKLYLHINNELQCILKKETWYKYNVAHIGDTLELTVVSESGFRTSKKIVKKPGKGDIYLIIDKKKKPPEIKKAFGRQIQGIESMMKYENRVYKNFERLDNLK